MTIPRLVLRARLAAVRLAAVRLAVAVGQPAQARKAPPQQAAGGRRHRRPHPGLTLPGTT